MGPDGGGPLEKGVKRSIIFVIAACFCVDGDMVQHEWHKYKTGGDVFSDVPNWYTGTVGFLGGVYTSQHVQFRSETNNYSTNYILSITTDADVAAKQTEPGSKVGVKKEPHSKKCDKCRQP